jgi:hypothetical protein
VAQLTANGINAFFTRLTAASGEFNRAKVGELGYLDVVYKDVKPEVGRKGQTIRVPFPDSGAWTDQSDNDWAPSSVNPNYVDLVLTQRPGDSKLITDFEQLQTDSDIVDIWLEPMFFRGQEFANAQIASLITTANFGVYPPLVSSNMASIDIGTAANAWDFLTTNKIPLRAGNGNILYHPAVHRNTLTDTNWYQENLVGALIATPTRREAASGEMNQGGGGADANMAFKFNRIYDQQAPVAYASTTGTVALTNGSTAVTGTSTLFTTTDAAVGVYVVFANQPGVRYKVQSIASATSMTLAQAFTGGTTASTTYTRETYTSIAMHKYAIALVLRPLEIPGPPAPVIGRIVNLRGIPIRVMLSYQHQYDGWLLTMDYGMVAGVLRPDFGIVIQS